MTVTLGHPTQTDDPLASQRTELLTQIVGSQFAVDAALAELVIAGGDTNVAGALRGQLAQLSALREQIGSANRTALAALRNEVAAAAGNSSAIVQQARTATANSAVELSQNLSQAAIASRASIRGALDSLRTIPLTFTSPEDEAEYRKREAERRAHIAAEQAKGTPQADLNASGAAVGQMVDAKAHGASGPEFEKQWNQLVATTERLREAARANGLSIEEFDRRLREDLRRILKSKGLSDAEIDAQFAAHQNDPLAAAKAYVFVVRSFETVSGVD